MDFGLSSLAACRLAGASYRQVDYWCRHGLVRPSVCEARGSGSRRRFDVHDVAVLRALRHLAEFGLTVDKVRPLAEHLHDLEPDEWLDAGRWVFPDGSFDFSRNGAPCAVWLDLEACWPSTADLVGLHDADEREPVAAIA